MIVLVINSGSSSVKFQVFDMTDEKVFCKGIVEKVGTSFAKFKLKPGNQSEYTETAEILDHKSAISRILSALVEPRFEILKSIAEIKVVGHRVVHGGEFFSGSRLLTPDVMNALEVCCELAPLHNPPNIRGIRAFQELLPDVPQVVVFDTAFHQTMPPTSFLYGLPYVLYERHKIRRYGFHGTSHKYAANEAAKFIGQPIEQLKIVTCHLGNGASITAVDGGVSIDTSMGFTPLEGLVMGTRCGDLDPAIIPFLIEKDGLSIEGINNLMNKHSGVYGVAGLGTFDMRDLEEEAERSNPRAILARQLYAYRVKKYIGAYIAALGGIDIIVFTGGVGENDWDIREKALVGLEFLGVHLDVEINRQRDKATVRRISDGSLPVLVVKADEELVIAREARMILTEMGGMVS